MFKRVGRRPSISLLAYLFVICAAVSFGQQEEQFKLLPLSETLLKRVAPDLRGAARKYVKYSKTYQQRLLTFAEAELREDILKNLVYNAPKAANLILDKLPKESTRIRSMILARIILRQHFRSNPRTYQVLENMVLNDPDVKISEESLEALRRLRMQTMRELLAKRLGAAKRSGDAAVIRKLAEEEERWISLERGTMLPSFLRTVPAPFAIRPLDRSIRLVAFGDFGDGGEAQKQTAAAIVRYHRERPFDFGLTLGDNFYVYGSNGTDDPRWKSQWEDLYGPLGIKFYASLGNHDWLGADSPAAEILYSQKSPTWRLPAPYYTFTAGPAQFFALDTNDISEAQLMWLKTELEKSTAKWKVVYGHHPIYYTGSPSETEERLAAALLPVLKGRADIYLTGHSHSLQHLKPKGGVHFFIAGGGGARNSIVAQTERTLFAKSAHGFAVIEANLAELKLSFLSSYPTPLYSYSIRK